MKQIFTKLKYLTDIKGQVYLGVDVPLSVVAVYLDRLKHHLGDDYFKYTHNQFKRDRGSHHITVVTVPEYFKIFSDKECNLLNTPVDYYIKGLGTGEIGEGDNKKVTYFLVVESERLNDIRSSLSLNSFDFHITLGFSPTDVFNVKKDETSLMIF